MVLARYSSFTDQPRIHSLKRYRNARAGEFGAVQPEIPSASHCRLRQSPIERSDQSDEESFGSPQAALSVTFPWKNRMRRVSRVPRFERTWRTKVTSAFRCFLPAEPRHVFSGPGK